MNIYDRYNNDIYYRDDRFYRFIKNIGGYTILAGGCFFINDTKTTITRSILKTKEFKKFTKIDMNRISDYNFIRTYPIGDGYNGDAFSYEYSNFILDTTIDSMLEKILNTKYKKAVRKEKLKKLFKTPLK